MAEHRDNATSCETSAQTVMEQQSPLTNTDTMAPFSAGPASREDLPSDSDASVLGKHSSALSHNKSHEPIDSDGQRMDRSSQRLAVPPIRTRFRSTSDPSSRNLQSALISSDESEGESDVFSNGQGLIQSTQATSSIGQASPLLATHDESQQAPGPETLLLDVQHDRVVGDNRHLLQEESILNESSAGPHSPCDDRSLRVAKDSIRGGGICFDEAPSSSDAESEDPYVPIAKVMSLHSRIWDCMIKTPTGQKFLPNGKLDELITKESVETVLREAFARDKPTWNKAKIERKTIKLAERICIKDDVFDDNGKYLQPIRQIFAILVLLETPSKILSFINANLSDYDLPLSFTEDEEMQISAKRRRNASNKTPLDEMSYFQQWQPGLKWTFWEMQWMVIAPVLSEGDYNDVQLLPLHEKDILPFIICEGSARKDVGHGAFGVVYKASIHPRHHNFSDKALCERGFAIKQIDQVKRKSFDQERNILKKFKGARSHPHVVSLLSTFQQGSNLGLVFYRADGDLRGFWKSNDLRSQVERKTSTWVAKQCAGLASALLRLHNHETFSRSSEDNEDTEEAPDSRKRVKIAPAPKHIHDQLDVVCGMPRDKPLHCKTVDELPRDEKQTPSSPPTTQQPDESGKIRKYGRHGDIKPENILWYKDHTDDLGVLQFTDFGVSDLKSDMSKSKVQSNLAGTLAYRAPEFDVPEWAIRPSADMWSLGCVYLEFITWLLGGEPLLKQFAFERLSWDIFGHVTMDTFFESDIVNHASGKTIKLRVKASVISFFNKLHEHKNCTEYIHEFLILIQDRMLVLESDDKAESNRILSEELYAQLNRFYEKCCKRELYTTEKQQWRCTLPTKRKPLDVRKTYVEVEIPRENGEDGNSNNNNTNNNDNSIRKAMPKNHNNNRNGISAMQRHAAYTRLQGHGLKENPQTH
ncbi:hypothetical protein F4678DRAFT_225831 [Xylaria arbuscula]|nr:hypothetical protein F4678DRAFT_225831 [Xylaria arbuscula]